jgi:hypothetical protein
MLIVGLFASLQFLIRFVSLNRVVHFFFLRNQCGLLVEVLHKVKLLYATHLCSYLAPCHSSKA